MFKCVISFILLISLGGLMGFLLAKPSLPTVLFLTLQGTATSLNPVNNDIYMTVRSQPQGSPFVALNNKSYTEIVKISKADFFSKKDKLEIVAHVQGAIMAATVSHNKKDLYFFWKKLEEKRTKYYTCKFDIKTHSISIISDYNTFGGRLKDVEGKYLIDLGDVYASTSQDEGRTWHRVLGEKAGKRSVAFEDGDIYYMYDNEIFKIAKEAIVDGTFNEEQLFKLEPDLNAGHLFVDTDKNIYVSVHKNKKSYIFNVGKQDILPASKSEINKKYVKTQLIFKYQHDFYCIFWAADSPSATEARILKITGDNILETESYSRSPTFLGTLDDYLIFNLDVIYQQKSYVFGIKYK